MYLTLLSLFQYKNDYSGGSRNWGGAPIFTIIYKYHSGHLYALEESGAGSLANFEI